MLEIAGLQYQPSTAAQPVLRDLDLRLQAGRPALVVGRSGSGKTTLLELIGGLAEASRGQILWNGQPVNGRQRRWLCGLVFQFPERHFLGLTVGQELRLGQRRLSNADAVAALARVGLQGLNLQSAPERLSGGQQRRLALAVQLLRDPKLLLLDEPTAGLDWAMRADILELLADLARERAVLVVTHEADLFAPIAGDSWLLESGLLRPLRSPELAGVSAGVSNPLATSAAADGPP